jgi:GAF domain-containing protein/HAMP domain-containing protein
MRERQPEHKDSEQKTARQAFVSLRTQLTIANLIVTLLAILWVGYYLLSRTQSLNTLLTEQLDKSVEQEAANRLNGLLSEGASDLNSFFSSTEKNLNTARIATETFLLQEKDASEGIYVSGSLWNANETLFALPNGSLDNPNHEVGSIFLPANGHLTSSLVQEINALKQLDSVAPIILKENSNIIALYFGGTSKETLYYPNIDLANIVPPDFDVTQRPWFVIATPEANPSRKIAWSVPYQDAALHGLVITSSAPIYDTSNRFRGVVAADVLMTSVTQAVSSIQAGETGYAFLIDQEGRIVIMPKEGYADFGIPADTPDEELVQYTLPNTVSLEMFKVVIKMVEGQRGLQKIEVNGVEKYFAYRPIPNVNYSLGIAVPTSELRKPFLTAVQALEREAATTIIFVFVILGVILAIATLVSWIASNILTTPLANLTRTASEIAAGNLAARADMKVRLAKDETTTLAETLNLMSAKVQELVATLEERVQERTSALQRRANQFQAVSEVARAAASIRDLDLLLSEVTRQISEQFGYYHAGIFLLDATAQNAVLVAANSAGGQKMLARRHQLAVEPRSIVGFVASTQSPRIALDTGADAVFFDNPDLPETCSEMAVPLKVGEQLIGVLDVQSTEKNAFSQEDIAVISTLADQVALAIENVRSFEKTQQALSKAEEAYQKYFGQSWAQFTRQMDTIGYAYKEGVVTPLNKTSTHSFADNDKGLFKLPLTLRGQTLGVLEIRSKQPKRAWKHDEMILIQAAAERAALALESAYLLEEARRRALRERVISEVTAKIGESINLKNILRTAVEELGRAIPGSEISISLQPQETDREAK